ncbi:FAD-dependent oxidoreductase [Agrobacterium tumefaciens]|uniref:FAD-dependent oxidoreductase n=1 Tax=Agrobacterium tumefaciens TaxID=358 RepID=UPI00385167A3
MSVCHLTRVGSFEEVYDLLIVGAGPAGLSAAITASELGLKVLLCDENASPGGQIYRGVTEASSAQKARLGRDYAAGAKLVARFLGSSSSYAPRTAVWSVLPLGAGAREGNGLEVGISLDGAARLIMVQNVILATGALERPFPIPDWTLPGVMTAGAAQIALKTSGLVPNGRTILAGTGPLLYLLASQLIDAGAPIATLIDTTPAGNRRRALSYVIDFARSPYGMKGLRLFSKVHRHVRVIHGAHTLAARGRDRLDEVVITHPGGTERLAVDLLLLHQGVVPNLNLSLATGCNYGWDETPATFTPDIDEWRMTSIPGVFIAGDAGGIVGAVASASQGEIAGLSVATRMGRLTEAQRDALAVPVRARLKNALRGRAFIDTLFRPAKAFRIPVHSDTIVCRCEKVTAGGIRDAASLGVVGPNQMKAFLRCGMGPCQGRLCGLTVTEILAEEHGISPADVGYYRLRAPVKPVALKELAALPKTDAAVMAVTGFVEKQG